MASGRSESRRRERSLPRGPLRRRRRNGELERQSAPTPGRHRACPGWPFSIGGRAPASTRFLGTHEAPLRSGRPRASHPRRRSRIRARRRRARRFGSGRAHRLGLESLGLVGERRVETGASEKGTRRACQRGYRRLDARSRSTPDERSAPHGWRDPSSRGSGGRAVRRAAVLDRARHRPGRSRSLEPLSLRSGMELLRRDRARRAGRPGRQAILRRGPRRVRGRASRDSRSTHRLHQREWRARVLGRDDRAHEIDRRRGRRQSGRRWEDHAPRRGSRRRRLQSARPLRSTELSRGPPERGRR